MPALDLLFKLERRTVVDEDSGCWVWMGSRVHDGYGWMTHQGKLRRCHRLGYELLVEPIPEGLTLDHLCRNRACWNPAHLEPVTSWENTLRGTNVVALNPHKTHCPYGHPYNDENTYVPPQGGERQCRACRSDQSRKAYAKLKAAQ